VEGPILPNSQVITLGPNSNFLFRHQYMKKLSPAMGRHLYAVLGISIAGEPQIQLSLGTRLIAPTVFVML
jgi:hypothetical protein